MAQRIIDTVTGVVSTTDAATTATVASFTIPSGSAFFAKAAVIGRNTSTGDMTRAELTHQGKNVAGTLSLVGSLGTPLVLGGDAGLATCTAIIDSSGTSIRVRVSGVALTTIEWMTELRVWLN